MRIPVQNANEEPKTYTIEEPLPTVPAKAEQAEPAPAEAEYRDLYLRAMADMANYRRRTEERAQEQVEEEWRRRLHEFLEFADNLDRALARLEEPGLRQGIQLTWEGLRRFLQQEGLEQVPAEGQPFDPPLHEAVATADNGVGPGRVVCSATSPQHRRIQ